MATIDNVMQGIAKNYRQQRTAQYDWINAMSRRTGQPHAQQFALQAVAPYAEASAKEVGDKALSSAQLDEKMREYNQQLSQRRKEFEQGQENWEKAYALQRQTADLNAALAKYKATGVFTPELMNIFGIGSDQVGRGDMSAVNRQLEALGINTGQANDSHLLYANGPSGNRTVDGVTYGPNHPMLRYI